MRTLSVLAGVLLLSLATASADDAKTAKSPDAPQPPPKPTLPSGTPSQQVKALVRQYDAAAADFRKLYEKAVDEAEQDRLFERYFPDADAYAALLIQVAERHPMDPAALDALLWAAEHARPLLNEPESPLAKATRTLVRDHLDSPKIGILCLALRHESAHNPGRSTSSAASGGTTRTRKLVRRPVSPWPTSFDDARSCPRLFGR